MTTLQFGLKAVRRSIIDTRKLTRKADRAAARPFLRFGGLVRSISRRSIRRPGKSPRTRSSRPGQPPKNQTGLLKKTIFFVYDRRARDVIVGPIKLGGRKGADVPEVLEKGGFVRTRSKARRSRQGKRQRARPFMRPAFDEALDKTPNLFKNSLR